MKLSKRSFGKVWREAVAAGRAAAAAKIPVPMVVVEHAKPFDDSSPIVRRWAPVMGGVCGFAWVRVRPSNSSFGRWLRANEYGRYSDYHRGVLVWVHDHGQSMEKKEAHARAMVDVFRSYGIECSWDSRMD